MTCEEVLKEEVVAWELFPISSKEDKAYSYSLIYSAMRKFAGLYAKSKASRQKEEAKDLANEVLTFLGHIQPRVGEEAFNHIYGLVETFKAEL